KPPESNPAHQPPRRREQEAQPVESKEVDETLRLGLPILRTNNWNNRLILLGGVAVALLLLAVAIWQLVMPALSSGDGDSRAEVTSKGPSPAGTTRTDQDAKGKPDTKKAGKGGDAQAEADRKNKAFKALMEEGRKAAQEKKYDAAIKAFEDAQKLVPGDLT